MTDPVLLSDLKGSQKINVLSSCTKSLAFDDVHIIQDLHFKCKVFQFQDYNNSHRDTENAFPFFVWSSFCPVVYCDIF